MFGLKQQRIYEVNPSFCTAWGFSVSRPQMQGMPKCCVPEDDRYKQHNEDADEISFLFISLCTINPVMASVFLPGLSRKINPTLKLCCKLQIIYNQNFSE